MDRIYNLNKLSLKFSIWTETSQLRLHNKILVKNWTKLCQKSAKKTACPWGTARAHRPQLPHPGVPPAAPAGERRASSCSFRRRQLVQFAAAPQSSRKQPPGKRGQPVPRSSPDLVSPALKTSTWLAFPSSGQQRCRSLPR